MLGWFFLWLVVPAEFSRQSLQPPQARRCGPTSRLWFPHYDCGSHTTTVVPTLRLWFPHCGQASPRAITAKLESCHTRQSSSRSESNTLGGVARL
jgi:hypothetical protein